MGELFSGADKKFEQVNDISMNIQEDRVKKLKQIFPEIESDGKIDWNKLKQILGGEITEEDERYRFTWSGKSKAIEEVSIPTTKTLRPSKSEDDSKNWDNTENLYIEGDNLEVLKVLQHSYNGKIKMIYIDPPYNTGNDFIYNDDFVLSMEEAEIKEGLKDEQGITKTVDRLTKNSKDSAKYHTRWLNMMYPRLSLARDLLTDDGVIFISIDDNEQEHIKILCDEIFGEKNFIAQVVWERAYAPVNLKKHFSECHDYIVCYAKNIDLLICNGLPRDEKSDDRYKNPDNDPRGVWQSDNLSVGPAVAQKVYEIEAPNGRKIMPPSGRCWLYTKERLKEMIDDNRIWFGEDGGNVPRLKRFLSEVKSGLTPMTIWKYTDVGHSQDAAQKLKALFDGKDYFDYPKSVELIKRCLQLYTNNDDLVLDFFSGSATTAHAIMQLNAEDAGNRKHIMVQLPELTDEKSEAYKAGYKNICEIGKERIRRAGEKIIEENNGKEGIENLDIGFKVFKLDDSNFNEWDTSYESLKVAIENSAKGKYTTYKEDRTHLDLVYEIMLKEGHMLTEKVEEIKVNNETIYKIGNGVMYIFLGKLNTEITNKIIELKNEAFDLYRLESPVVILNETYMDTEMKSNARKSFESNGIKDIKTL